MIQECSQEKIYVGIKFKLLYFSESLYFKEGSHRAALFSERKIGMNELSLKVKYLEQDNSAVIRSPGKWR